MTQSSAPIGHLSILRGLIRGGILNAAGIGFSLYIVAICYSGVVASPDMLMSLRTGAISMADAGESNLHLAVPPMIVGLAIFARHGALAVFQEQKTLLVILSLFSGAVIFPSLLTGSLPVSVAQITQYLATVMVFILSLCFWQASRQDVDNALAMACLALVGVLVAGALVQGFHDYRWVGLIHPNHYARYAYVALVLHSIVTRRVSLFATLLAFSAAYMVSARTILIGILLFYIGYALLTARGLSADPRRQKARANLLAWQLIATAFATIAIFILTDSDALLDRLSNDFAVFDAERGILSGFTGRSSSWTGFFETMPDFVLYGYGFRSGRYELHAVHSGVLSYFMDFGLIFGGALLAAVLARTIYLIAKGRSSHNHTMLICGLALLTTLIIQYFEPDNFNIGFIGSLFFIVILGYTPPVKSRAKLAPLNKFDRPSLIAPEMSQKVVRKW